MKISPLETGNHASPSEVLQKIDHSSILEIDALDDLRSEARRVINARMSEVFSAGQLLVLEHNFFVKIVGQMTTRFPQVKSSSWYHQLIGSTPTSEMSCADDLPAYDMLKASLEGLSEEIQDGEHDHVFHSYMLRKNIACLVEKGRI